MKKIFFMALTMLIIASCNVFSKTKLDYNEFNFDYNTGSIETIEEIKQWGSGVLNEVKIELEENIKSGIKVIKPKLSSSFNNFDDKGIKTIVFSVFKDISGNHPETFIKIFYNDKDGNKLEKNDIIKLDSDLKISSFEKKIKEKIKNIEGIFTEESEILEGVKNYLKDLKFYFDSGRIIFLFDPYIIGPYSKGTIEIEFYFDELKEYLNPELFPEIKKELEEKARKEAEKNKKSKTLSESDKKNLNNGKKYVALTFDDGPSNKTTPKLLDILKKYDVKATFFVLGKLVAAYPNIVKREFEEGHEIANHSWDHPNLVNLKNEAVKKQIFSTDDEIKKVIGKSVDLVRPPYGAHNKRVNDLIGKTIVMWNVDSLDWKHKNVKKNLDTSMSQVQNGSIILFHDIHQTSVDTIEPLIKKLKEQGYEFLTVSELLNIGQGGDFSKKVCSGEFNCYSY
ncbi:hypothetical protein DLH72_00330 [Candidatus Gracilibacteria bacterium]|nr:MAG: hypothetical protein DLH72_00330 [Candidatus Gracilibacteria bacterium]